MKSLQISNLAVGEGVLRDFLASSPVCIAFGSISLARGDDDSSSQLGVQTVFSGHVTHLVQ